MSSRHVSLRAADGKQPDVLREVGGLEAGIIRELRFRCTEPVDRLRLAVTFFADAVTRTDRVRRYRDAHPRYPLVSRVGGYEDIAARNSS